MSDAVTGRYFEEFIIGDTYKHAIRRTVTETDNLLFSALTHNTQPLHLDEEFCKNTMYGTRIVNSIFTLGLVCGVGVGDLTLGTTLGNLGFGEVKFTHPVFVGDTIRSETEVVGKRESRSRPDAGIIELESRAYNQRNELVTKFRRFQLMRKKSSVTAAAA
jgi:acyl dehydratase